MKRIGVLTSGGDAPGMNALIPDAAIKTQLVIATAEAEIAPKTPALAAVSL